MKFFEATQQGIILLEVLAEAEPGIEHDALALYTGHGGFVGPVAQLALYQHHDVRDGRERAPFFRAAAHVHQDTPHFSPATVLPMAGSQRRALTSLTISAPASTAARATAAL